MLLSKVEGRQALEQLLRAFPGGVHCATGHRVGGIHGFTPEKFDLLVSVAQDSLRSARTQVLIAGGATGWDQAAAQAAINLGLPLVLVLPFARGQDDTFAPWDARRHAEHLGSASVAYACTPSVNGWKDAVRWLMERNTEMLRRAHGVLPLHSGIQSGGTFRCLREARTRGVFVFENAWSRWLDVVTESALTAPTPREVIASLQGTLLSNFAPVPVRLSGVVYPSVEAAYQAAKTADHAAREVFLRLTPGQAKRHGKTLELRADWEDIKLEVMAGLLRQKFRQEPYRSALLATGDSVIQEGNSWGDTYWGVVAGKGENHLGRLLMEVREELRSQARRAS